MADDVPQYEYTSVRAVRGMEARTIAKWVKDGWELDAQSHGSMLRTELTFRRVKPKTPPWRVLAVAGAVLVLALVIAVGVLTERRGGAGTADAAAVTSAQNEQPAAATASAAAPTQTTADETLTAENNPELAALLALKDPGADSVGEFAAKYRGRTIEFDGNIGAMNHHDDDKTRYDILVGAGDFSETSSAGPNFQFNDVNITLDLRLTGSNIPDAIGVGDNLHVVAQVGDYNPTQELFRLEPVSTEVR